MVLFSLVCVRVKANQNYALWDKKCNVYIWRNINMNSNLTYCECTASEPLWICYYGRDNIRAPFD